MPFMDSAVRGSSVQTETHDKNQHRSQLLNSTCTNTIVVTHTCMAVFIPVARTCENPKAIAALALLGRSISHAHIYSHKLCPVTLCIRFNTHQQIHSRTRCKQTIRRFNVFDWYSTTSTGKSIRACDDPAEAIPECFVAANWNSGWMCEVRVLSQMIPVQCWSGR